ncbi:MAG TPA: uracil-DNA glycosylase, partial [Candidatus Krumholzibacterium sp.]|nr:uracil-DNA glycosylase [Candidatus Krumholzibacterium sp.]
MNAEQKMQLLGELFDDWTDCERCGLCSPRGRKRNNVVFGEGNPDANLMVIGEAPGDHEDVTGRPFAGRSGEIIDMYLESFNSSRDEVFITNMVGCRPTEPDKAQQNRAPSKQEIAACLPRVSRIIE